MAILHSGSYLDRSTAHTTYSIWLANFYVHGKTSAYYPPRLRRGGFTTKVHVSVDALGNPLRFRLTAGQSHDITQAEALLTPEPFAFVIADKSYDAEHFLRTIVARGAVPVIPPRSHRKTPRDYPVWRIIRCA